MMLYESEQEHQEMSPVHGALPEMKLANKEGENGAIFLDVVPATLPNLSFLSFALNFAPSISDCIKCPVNNLRVQYATDDATLIYC